MIKVLQEIKDERARQDAKWGEQNHPDADPVLLARKRLDPARLAEEHEIPTASRAKFICQEAGRRGESNWTAIAVEELCEAVEQAALKDVAALRAELVQTAAVLVQWIEAIDRRGAR